MAKPKKERNVLYPPKVSFFKPQGIPLVRLQKVILNVDEYEAIRLVDYEGLDQEKAAKKLGISRPTCARIVEDAHKKIAEAITQGKAIQIEGGSFILLNNLMRCRNCGQLWETAGEEGGEENGYANKTVCPQCSSLSVVDLGRAVGGGWQGEGRGFKSRRGRGMQGGRRGEADRP